MKVREKQISFTLFLLLLILMPMHHIIFSCLLSNVKILSLWRDVIILYLVWYSTRGRIRCGFADLSILLSIVVICIFALSQGAFGPLNMARTYCVPLLIFFYVKNTKFSDKEIRKIVTTCWAVATGIAVWGILQAFVLGPEVLLNIGYSGENGKFSSASFYINHWDQQRVVGTFSSPNACGAYFAVMLLFLLSMKDKADMNKAVFNCGLALIGIGMITSFSRSAWIGFAVAFVFIREWKLR